MTRVLLSLSMLLAGSLFAICAENPDEGGVPVHLVVTAEGKNIPSIQAAGVMVHQCSTRAGLQLTLLIDDGLNTRRSSSSACPLPRKSPSLK